MVQPTAAQQQHVINLIGPDHAAELQARGINLTTVAGLFLTFLNGLIAAMLAPSGVGSPSVPSTSPGAKK